MWVREWFSFHIVFSVSCWTHSHASIQTANTQTRALQSVIALYTCRDDSGKRFYELSESARARTNERTNGRTDGRTERVIFEYLCHILLVTNNKKLPFYLLVLKNKVCMCKLLYTHLYTWKMPVLVCVRVVCFFRAMGICPYSVHDTVVGWRRHRRCRRRRHHLSAVAIIAVDSMLLLLLLWCVSLWCDFIDSFHSKWHLVYSPKPANKWTKNYMEIFYTAR